MIKTFSLLACMLLLSVMLAACAGGDDDDPTATVVPSTATTEPAAAEDEDEEEDASPTAEAADEPTATEEPSEPTVEPTEEAEPTATEESTQEPTEAVSTPEVSGTMPPVATEDADGPAGTAEADYEPDPAVEAALMDMLLTEEEVPEEFVLVSAGPVATSNGGLTFCNEESFSRPEARLGSVEAEFEVDPQLGPFVLESLTAYDEEVAAEAFDYARDITTSCEEWTDEDGVTYQLEIIEVPDYGDDSHGLRMTFEVPGAGQAAVEITLARFGGVLLAMGFISLEGTDTTQFQEITETAIEKIEAADPLP